MNHLDLAYEKLSDLVDELQWAQYRYALGMESLKSSAYSAFLKKMRKRHKETAIHLTALIQKVHRDYEGFDIADSYVDEAWTAITEDGFKKRDVLKFCLNQDKVVLNQMTTLIDDGWLPTEILSALVSAEFALKESKEELKKLRKNLKKKASKKKSSTFLKALKLRF